MMMLPIVGALPAQYKMVSDLHLKDSPLFLLTCTGGFGFNFIILYAFFQNPFLDIRGGRENGRRGKHEDIFADHAAAGDALGHHAGDRAGDRVLERLHDADFVSAFVSDACLGLYEFDPDRITGGSYPVYFAGLMLSMLPVLAVFGVFQNTIMQNTVAGGLKG